MNGNFYNEWVHHYPSLYLRLGFFALGEGNMTLFKSEHSDFTFF